MQARVAATGPVDHSRTLPEGGRRNCTSWASIPIRAVPNCLPSLRRSPPDTDSTGQHRTGLTRSLGSVSSHASLGPASCHRTARSRARMRQEDEEESGTAAHQLIRKSTDLTGSGVRTCS